VNARLSKVLSEFNAILEKNLPPDEESRKKQMAGASSRAKKRDLEKKMDRWRRETRATPTSSGRRARTGSEESLDKFMPDFTHVDYDSEPESVCGGRLTYSVKKRAKPVSRHTYKDPRAEKSKNIPGHSHKKELDFIVPDSRQERRGSTGSIVSGTSALFRPDFDSQEFTNVPFHPIREKKRVAKNTIRTTAQPWSNPLNESLSSIKTERSMTKEHASTSIDFAASRKVAAEGGGSILPTDPSGDFSRSSLLSSSDFTSTTAPTLGTDGSMVGSESLVVSPITSPKSVLVVNDASKSKKKTFGSSHSSLEMPKSYKSLIRPGREIIDDSWQQGNDRDEPTTSRPLPPRSKPSLPRDPNTASRRTNHSSFSRHSVLARSAKVHGDYQYSSTIACGQVSSMDVRIDSTNAGDSSDGLAGVTMPTRKKTSAPKTMLSRSTGPQKTSFTILTTDRSFVTPPTRSPPTVSRHEREKSTASDQRHTKQPPGRRFDHLNSHRGQVDVHYEETDPFDCPPVARPTRGEANLPLEPTSQRDSSQSHARKEMEAPELKITKEVLTKSTEELTIERDTKFELPLGNSHVSPSRRSMHKLEKTLSTPSNTVTRQMTSTTKDASPINIEDKSTRTSITKAVSVTQNKSSLSTPCTSTTERSRKRLSLSGLLSPMAPRAQHRTAHGKPQSPGKARSHQGKHPKSRFSALAGLVKSPDISYTSIQKERIPKALPLVRTETELTQDTAEESSFHSRSRRTRRYSTGGSTVHSETDLNRKPAAYEEHSPRSYRGGSHRPSWSARSPAIAASMESHSMNYRPVNETDHLPRRGNGRQRRHSLGSSNALPSRSEDHDHRRLGCFDVFESSSTRHCRPFNKRRSNANEKPNLDKRQDSSRKKR